MAEPDAEPTRPGGAPKYLPRLKYTPPPEPDPNAPDAETIEGLPLADGAKPSPAKPISPKPPANPSRPGALPASRERAEPAPAKPKPASPKRRSRIDDPPDAPAGSLIEATPEGETFEGRRRIRLIIGGVTASVILVSIFLVWRSLRPADSTPDDEPGFREPPVAATPPVPRKSPAQLQSEADGLLTEARTLEKVGKADEALAKVESILAVYADTPSAKLAEAARDRFRHGLPLFPGGVAVIATKAGPKAMGPDPGVDVEGVDESTTIATDTERPRPLPTAPGRSATVMPPGTTVAPTVTPEPAKSKVVARPLPPGFRPKDRAGIHPSGWPLEIVCERDGGTLVLVPGDQFIQGRDDGKPEERPAHRVQLSTYYIDQHEVTARQFSAFRPGGAKPDDKPVVNVSLADARAYAEWAGKSIPTEAQWEMAARATDGRVHPWGNAPPDFAGRRQPRQIDPVMSFPGDQSPYGAFDLAGNAWEWTNDWFDARAYAKLKGQVVTNPAGPARGGGRLPEVVIKGGAKDWDGSWRSGMQPGAKLPYLGFRCVLNLGNAGSAPAPPTNGQRPASGAVPF